MRERSVYWLPLLRTWTRNLNILTGDQTHSPGTHPDRESSLQPFSYRTVSPPTEPCWPRLIFISINYSNEENILKSNSISLGEVGLEVVLISSLHMYLYIWKCFLQRICRSLFWWGGEFTGKTCIKRVHLEKSSYIYFFKIRRGAAIMLFRTWHLTVREGNKQHDSNVTY